MCVYRSFHGDHRRAEIRFVLHECRTNTCENIRLGDGAMLSGKTPGSVQACEGVQRELSTTHVKVCREKCRQLTRGIFGTLR